jgi:hypothetical protein
MMLLFAAVHESGNRTKRTCRAHLTMSVDGVRPEVAGSPSNRRYDPKLTSIPSPVNYIDLLRRLRSRR